MFLWSYYIYFFSEKFHRSPSISDLAFLLAFSSTSDGLKDKNMLWFTNGVGKEYSPQAGFGLPRLDKISTFLSSWTPIESPTVYKFSRFDRSVDIESELKFYLKHWCMLHFFKTIFEINVLQKHSCMSIDLTKFHQTLNFFDINSLSLLCICVFC